MSGEMIAGIILFIVGALTTVLGVIANSDEGDYYIWFGGCIAVIGFLVMVSTLIEC